MDTWNTSHKKIKEKFSKKTCLYSQVYNVNPLMGGFITFGDTYESSTFNSYSFTGKYKVVAQDNYVSVITTETCSSASVNFYRALVVFQPIVEPIDRKTKCNQEVIFNENKYTVEVTPFERYDIDVGTLILATDNVLSFSTFDLPSKTNQEKISKALYEYINSMKAGYEIIDDNGNILPQQLTAQETKVQVDMNLYSFLLYATPPANGIQYITLFTNSTKWQAGKSQWYVMPYGNNPIGGNRRVVPDAQGRYKLIVGNRYKIGFSTSDTPALHYVFNFYKIYSTPIANNLINVIPDSTGW